MIKIIGIVLEFSLLLFSAYLGFTGNTQEATYMLCIAIYIHLTNVENSVFILIDKDLKPHVSHALEVMNQMKQPNQKEEK